MKNKAVLKDETIAECSVVSSHVPTLKHEVEQKLLTWQQLFQLLQETNKQLFAGHMPLCSFVLQCRNISGAWLNIQWDSHLFKWVSIVFFDRVLSECTCISVVSGLQWSQQSAPALKTRDGDLHWRLELKSLLSCTHRDLKLDSDSRFGTCEQSWRVFLIAVTRSDELNLIPLMHMHHYPCVISTTICNTVHALNSIDMLCSKQTDWHVITYYHHKGLKTWLELELKDLWPSLLKTALFDIIML